MHVTRVLVTTWQCTVSLLASGYESNRSRSRLRIDKKNKYKDLFSNWVKKSRGVNDAENAFVINTTERVKNVVTIHHK